ncbi:MAG: molecular chaperone DnaK, partial [Solirubrobacteraceae bacterium]|nr:molecular chaperone DnaK [Solirubrobacteraceae bacterium]
EVRESLTSEDAADISARTERLQTAFHKVSEAMYERAQAQQQAASPNGDGDGAATPEGEEEVVDAEVVDDQQR